jgi:hypothetical protein
MFHLSLAKNIREKFGKWEDNPELLESCGAFNPDDASRLIVKSIWRLLAQSS